MYGDEIYYGDLADKDGRHDIDFLNLLAKLLDSYYKMVIFFSFPLGK